MERKKKETIGLLDTLVMIQRKSITENSFAEKVETWNDLLEVWSGVKYPSTSTGENYDDGINVAVRSIVFEIRNTDVTVTDRISFDGMFFDINSIEKDRLNARFKLYCSSSR